MSAIVSDCSDRDLHSARSCTTSPDSICTTPFARLYSSLKTISAQGSEAALQLLLSNGASLNMADHEGQSAVYHAAKLGNTLQAIIAKYLFIQIGKVSQFSCLMHDVIAHHIPYRLVCWLNEGLITGPKITTARSEHLLLGAWFETLLIHLGLLVSSLTPSLQDALDVALDHTHADIVTMLRYDRLNEDSSHRDDNSE